MTACLLIPCTSIHSTLTWPSDCLGILIHSQKLVTFKAFRRKIITIIKVAFQLKQNVYCTWQSDELWTINPNSQKNHKTQSPAAWYWEVFCAAAIGPLAKGKRADGHSLFLVTCSSPGRAPALSYIPLDERQPRVGKGHRCLERIPLWQPWVSAVGQKPAKLSPRRVWGSPQRRWLVFPDSSPAGAWLKSSGPAPQSTGDTGQSSVPWLSHVSRASFVSTVLGRVECSVNVRH